MAASERTRITVDVPDKLLGELEEQVEEDEWLNRSEAVRHGIRKALSERREDAAQE